MTGYAPTYARAARVTSLLAFALLASSAIAQPTPPKPPFINPLEISQFSRDELRTLDGLNRFRIALDHDKKEGRLGTTPVDNELAYKARVDRIDEMKQEIKSRALANAVNKAEQLAENGSPSDRDAVFNAVTDALRREAECQKIGIDCSFEKPPARVLLKYRDSVLKKCDTNSTRLTRAFVLELKRLFDIAGEREASPDDWAKCYEFIAKTEQASGADFSGNVQNIKRPFSLNARIPGGAGSFSFQPTSSDAGTVNYEMRSSGAVDTGSGTYTLSPVSADKNGAMRLQPSTHGCVVMQGFRNCANRTATILLTPQ